MNKMDRMKGRRAKAFIHSVHSVHSSQPGGAGTKKEEISYAENAENRGGQ